MATGAADSGDLDALMSAGGVHVVCFADAHAQDESSLMATGAGLDETERRLFCERVNAEDTTGCLWPIARVSALPSRFAHLPLEDAEGLRRCLLRVFDLNATLCKCPVLVLYLRGAPTSADILAEAERLGGEAPLVREVLIR